MSSVKGDISLMQNFQLISEKPLDGRFEVETSADLKALITEKAAYPGLIVYNKQTKTQHIAIEKNSTLTFVEIPITFDTNYSVSINDGVANGDYSIASGTADTDFFEDLLGSLANRVNASDIKAPEANGTLSISLGNNNKSDSSASITLGVSNRAGIHGYKWTNIDFSTKTITLAEKPIDWSVGDYITIVNGDVYAMCTTIESIDTTKNRIQVKTLPFEEDFYTLTNITKPAYYLPYAQTIYALAITEENATNEKSRYVIRSGNNSIILGIGAYVSGTKNIGAGTVSNASGYNTLAAGNFDHAEGNNTVAAGGCSHAEGKNTWTKGYASHAEGRETEANASYSHAEGYMTYANGGYSHTEGCRTVAQGTSSHAGGSYTIASADNQTVIGTYNLKNDDALFIVGNGTSSNRRNAFEVISNSEGDAIKVGSTLVRESDLKHLLTFDLFETVSGSEISVPSNVVPVAEITKIYAPLSDVQSFATVTEIPFTEDIQLPIIKPESQISVSTDTLTIETLSDGSLKINGHTETAGGPPFINLAIVPFFNGLWGKNANYGVLYYEIVSPVDVSSLTFDIQIGSSATMTSTPTVVNFGTGAELLLTITQANAVTDLIIRLRGAEFNPVTGSAIVEQLKVIDTLTIPEEITELGVELTPVTLTSTSDDTNQGRLTIEQLDDCTFKFNGFTSGSGVTDKPFIAFAELPHVSSFLWLNYEIVSQGNVRDFSIEYTANPMFQGHAIPPSTPTCIDLRQFQCLTITIRRENLNDAGISNLILRFTGVSTAADDATPPNIISYIDLEEGVLVDKIEHKATNIRKYLKDDNLIQVAPKGVITASGSVEATFMKKG